MRYPDFGRWVRSVREVSGKSQERLAEEVGTRQQIWSRIESEGFIPEGVSVASICKALDRSEQEVKRYIKDEDTSRDLIIQQEEIYNFKLKSIIVGGNKDYYSIETNKPVYMYLIREDYEPVNDESINTNYEFLSNNENLYLLVLFRFSDPVVWESFRWFAGALARKWVSSNHDINDLKKRLRGYYRHPEWEEDRARFFPMLHPVVLCFQPTGPKLFYYDLDDQLYKYLIDNDSSPSEATQKSTLFVSKPDSDRASRIVASWIGAEGLLGGTEPERWMPILWPEISFPGN